MSQGAGPAGRGRVVGRYLLADEVAAGGMATVRLARLLGPAGFARTVAVKELHPHFAAEPEFVAMFLDEARIASRIRHPNVVPTLDVVVEGREVLLVMEYVHGEPVSRLVRAQRAATGAGVPVDIALGVVAGALHGLHAAHEAHDDFGAPLGIVHRDVSPQNVLVGADGVARVVDFGVAKASGRLQATREGVLKGKLAYMSPEQVSSTDVDRRTDVYAAAVVLWEMLTGTRLFAGDAEVHVLQAVLAGRIVPPSQVVTRELPPGVDALVMRGLAHDRGHRFATAWDMAEEAQRLGAASPGRIGAWVASIAGNTLAARAARIAEIESQSAPSRGLPFVEPAPREEARTATTTTMVPTLEAATRPVSPPPADPTSQLSTVNVTTGLTTAHGGRGGGSRAVAGVVVALVALGLGGLLAVTLVGRDGAGTTGAATAPSALPVATPIDATTSAPSATAAAPSAAPPAASSAPPAASAAPAAASPASPRAPSPATRPTSVARPARPGCNPPYTIDARGVRVPKLECL